MNENVDGGAANGSEWRLWLSKEISQGKVTTIPSFNSIGGGFTNDLQQGLLCEAHKQGIRVLDWDTVGSLWGDFNFVNCIAIRYFLVLSRCLSRSP